MINVITLMGRLVATPELKTTNSGVEVCSFTIAVDRNYASGGEKLTDFINIQSWRGTAKFICNYFQKGQMIALNGSLQSRQYTDKDGNKRTAYEVVADNVSFCGSKSESGGNYGGSQEAPASFSNADAGDFVEIAADNGDYPF